MHVICPGHCHVGEGLLPERSISVKEAQGTKATQVNARMGTVDHDRQGQAGCSQTDSPHNSSVKFSESVCVASVASLTEEIAVRSTIAYHAHGTADGDKFCCYPWLVCHDIKSAMHCSLRLAPTMINHLTS